MRLTQPGRQLLLGDLLRVVEVRVETGVDKHALPGSVVIAPTGAGRGILEALGHA